MTPINRPNLDRRGWLKPRFKVGAHVRAPQLDLCGSIASVLRFPHQVGYGVLFDDCRPHDEMSSAVFGERDLVEVTG